MRFCARETPSLSTGIPFVPSMHSPELYWSPADGLVVDITYKFPGLRSVGSVLKTNQRLSTFNKEQPPFYLIAVISLLILPPHAMAGQSDGLCYFGLFVVEKYGSLFSGKPQLRQLDHISR